jgi:hypothetical protein
MSTSAPSTFAQVRPLPALAVQSPRVQAARRRAQARRDQDGAAMFVVSMMITVLGAVGMFALAASATEVKTAGNERQSAQTHYLSELALVASQRELGAGKIQTVLSLMGSSASSNKCVSLPLPSTLAPTASQATNACLHLDAADLQKVGAWNTAATTAYTVAPYATGVPPGSLGPVPVAANFGIEVTDVKPWEVSGMSGQYENGCLVTVTAVGQTLPLLASGAGSFSGEGTEMLRARMVVTGPCNGR